MGQELGISQAMDTGLPRTDRVRITPTFRPDPSSSPSHLAELMCDVAAGDEQAFARLYDATVNRVYSVALRMLGNPATAEEVALDTYMQAWRTADRYDPSRASVLTWLLVICRSRALDSLRSLAARQPECELEGIDAEASDASDPALLCERRQSRLALGRCFQGLSPPERQLITLAFYRGLSHAELAAQTGLPLGTVKSVVRRALRKMREALTDPSASVRS